MFQKPPSCRACPLWGTGQGYVPADGSGTNGVLIVGEAAGETEERIGRPFVGAAGYYLDRLLKRAGLPREGFRIHNVLSCRPENNKLSGMWYEAEAINCCRENLDRTILLMKPRVIVALGGTALERLTGHSEITRYRGYVLPGPQGSWVVPTFHPSFLLPRKGQANTSRFVGAVIRDLRKADYIARHGFERQDAMYLCDPPPHIAAAFAEEYEAAGDVYLSFDIETPYKMKVGDEGELVKGEEEEEEEFIEKPPPEDPIMRISFCFKPGYAMSIPWSGPYLPIIKRLMGSPRPKIGWNSTLFDTPKIEGNGVEVNGERHDGMWAWHVLQSALPKGLESVTSYFAPHILPWKHLSSAEPARYNAIDADAALCNMLGIEKELKDHGQWEAYLKHNVKLDPILYQIGNVHGVHIDKKAQEELRIVLTARMDELDEVAQGVVPEGLKPTKHYKRPPEGLGATLGNRAAIEGRVFVPRTVIGILKRCSVCGAGGVTKTSHLKGGKKNPCYGATIEVIEGEVMEWDEILPFNPNSVKQLTNYVLYYKHPLGKHRVTKRPTLGKRQVEILENRYGLKHPIYKIALEQRGIKKAKGTYVDGLIPDNKGLIYTTYSHNPASPRLSSANVNLQNISHRGNVAYAKEIRRTIIPPPGRVFVKADASAIEAVMVGYFMGDKEYIHYAHQGIHDILTCRWMGLVPDMVDFGELKKDEGYYALRETFKVVVHGTSYGMTPKLMRMQYPKVFKSTKAAEEAQQFFLSTCPRLPKWHHETRLRAHKDTYLSLPWGYRGYFYDVFGKDRDGKITLGSDGNSCISYQPQGAAACVMMDNLLLFWEELGEERRDWMRANVVCHDDYTLAPPVGQEEIAMEMQERILTRPIPELGGLRVGCEISIGPNWGDMEMVRRVGVE